MTATKLPLVGWLKFFLTELELNKHKPIAISVAIYWRLVRVEREPDLRTLQQIGIRGYPSLYLLIMHMGREMDVWLIVYNKHHFTLVADLKEIELNELGRQQAK